MVSVQAGCTGEEALVMMQERAAAQHQTIVEIANEVRMITGQTADFPQVPT